MFYSILLSDKNSNYSRDKVRLIEQGFVFFFKYKGLNLLSIKGYKVGEYLNMETKYIILTLFIVIILMQLTIMSIGE